MSHINQLVYMYIYIYIYVGERIRSLLMISYVFLVGAGLSFGVPV